MKKHSSEHSLEKIEPERPVVEKKHSKTGSIFRKLHFPHKKKLVKQEGIANLKNLKVLEAKMHKDQGLA